MTNYKINDARRHWNAPSIDFVLLDGAGHMVIVELKREIRTPREGWDVVCQVSHRAQALAAGFSQPLIESAYLDCRSGLDGRTTRSADVTPPLHQAHADAFGQQPLKELPALPIRRMVMANEFGPSFANVLSVMNASSQDHVATILGLYGLSRSFIDSGTVELSLVTAAAYGGVGGLVGTAIGVLFFMTRFRAIE